MLVSRCNLLVIVMKWTLKITVLGILMVSLVGVTQTAQAATLSANFEQSLRDFKELLIAFSAALKAQLLGAEIITVGSDAALATALKNATGGETIALEPGTYGTILIVGGQYSQILVGTTKFTGSPTLTSPVTITSANPAKPAVVLSIDVRLSDNWHFDNLDIRPGNQSKSFTAVSLSGANVTFENSTISFGDYRQWLTATDWAVAGGAMIISGPNATIRNNYVSGVYHGILFLKGAEGSIFARNTIDGIGGDASRILADNMLVEKNLFKNFYVNDGNHDDCMQSYGTTNNIPDPEAWINNVTIRDNICLQTTTDNYSDPMLSYPQGYVSFDGGAKDWVVENNVYVSTAYHGIFYSGATNITFRNNTIIDSNPNQSGVDAVWLRVGANKPGTIIATGNTMQNNISNRFPVNSAPEVTTFVNNANVKIVDYSKYFRDWKAGDVRLVATSPLQNIGANLDPATVGSTRTFTPQDQMPTSTTSNPVSTSTPAEPTSSPLPIVSLIASPALVTETQNTTLYWSSSNALSCTASGAWSGEKALAGTESSGLLTTGTKTFTLTCTGAGGTVATSTAVTVNPTPAPVYKYSVGTAVMTTSNINVRSTPEGKVVGKQSNGNYGVVGTPAPVVSGGYTWVYVVFASGASGWVADAYLTIQTSSATPLVIGSHVTVTDSVKVRESYSTNAKQLGVRKVGDAGTIITGPQVGDGYTWWKIDFESGADGWVVANYLR